MSVISRLTTWVTNQVLTSSALNGEFNNVVNTLNNLDGATTSWTNVKTGTLNITAQVASLALNSQKITGLANGTASTDAAAFGQIYYGFQSPVQATGATTTSLTLGSFVNTVVTASITPTSASHRIKVTACFVAIVPTASGGALFSLTRNGTDLSAGSSGFAQVGNASAAVNAQTTISYIDSPASTSSQAYVVTGENLNGAGTITVGNGRLWTIILEEIV